MGNKNQHNTNNEYLEQHNAVLLDAIRRKKPLNSHRYPPDTLFKFIYDELLSAYQEQRPAALKPTKVNATIVLVPGILNEIFDTVAFEEGAQELTKETGINYLAIRVHGVTGSDENALALFQALQDYKASNPTTGPFWLLAHSKGGIDCLHLLVKHKEFCAHHVLGLSTVASPLRGSKQPSHLLVRMINKLYRWPMDLFVGKKLSEMNLKANEVGRALSISYLRKWWKKK